MKNQLILERNQFSQLTSTRATSIPSRDVPRNKMAKLRAYQSYNQQCTSCNIRKEYLFWDAEGQLPGEDSGIWGHGTVKGRLECDELIDSGYDLAPPCQKIVGEPSAATKLSIV